MPAALYSVSRLFSFVLSSNALRGALDALGKRPPAFSTGIVSVVIFSVHFSPALQVFQMCGRWKGWVSDTSWNASEVVVSKLPFSLSAMTGLATEVTHFEPQTQVG